MFLTRSNAADIFDELENQIFFPAFYRSSSSKETETAATSKRFRPTMDVLDYGKEIVVQVELAGIPKEQVKIEVHDRNLIISGESNLEEHSQKAKWNVQERFYGSFQRQILLPKDIDTNSIAAKFENGLLEVKINRLAEVPPNKRSISIE